MIYREFLAAQVGIWFKLRWLCFDLNIFFADFLRIFNRQPVFFLIKLLATLIIVLFFFG